MPVSDKAPAYVYLLLAIISETTGTLALQASQQFTRLGNAFIAVIAYLVYGGKLDLPAVLGVSLILAGILIIHLFSSSATH